MVASTPFAVPRIIFPPVADMSSAMAGVLAIYAPMEWLRLAQPASIADQLLVNIKRHVVLPISTAWPCIYNWHLPDRARELVLGMVAEMRRY